jgi:hypothetical protein
MPETGKFIVIAIGTSVIITKETFEWKIVRNYNSEPFSIFHGLLQESAVVCRFLSTADHSVIF